MSGPPVSNFLNLLGGSDYTAKSMLSHSALNVVPESGPLQVGKGLISMPREKAKWGPGQWPHGPPKSLPASEATLYDEQAVTTHILLMYSVRMEQLIPGYFAGNLLVTSPALHCRNSPE